MHKSEVNNFPEHRGGPRLSDCFASASGASRSEATAQARLNSWTSAQRKSCTDSYHPNSEALNPRCAHPAFVRFPHLSNQQSRKVNLPDLPLLFSQAEAVSDKCFSHKSLASSPPDLSVAAHSPDHPAS